MKNYGGEEERTYLPVAQPTQWVQVVVSTYVTGRRCTISLYSNAKTGNWANFDYIEFVPGQARSSIRGADISSLNKSEDFGGTYRTEKGKEREALKALRSESLNWACLRVWVDPADGYHDKDELLQMATRIKRSGMHLLVDLHYSDTWADLGHKTKFFAWQDLPFDELKQAVYDYIYDVCNSLMEQHAPPAMVQIGNELNSGML